MWARDGVVPQALHGTPAPWRPTAGSQNLGPGRPGGLACMEQSGLQRVLCAPHLVESSLGDHRELEPASLL